MADIRIGVVEDEAIIADTIVVTLEKMGYTCLEPAASYGAAIEMIEQDRPDLLLVDIRLAGRMSGIDLGKRLQAVYGIPFIYLTSNTDAVTLDEAKVTRPEAFLAKPFNRDELYAAIEVALFKRASGTAEAKAETPVSDHIFLKSDGKLIKVMLDAIEYVMSDHVYLEVHEKTQRHLLRMKMEDLLAALPANFLQVHRRYAVNIDKVDTIATTELNIGERIIPVSKSHRDRLLEAINRI